VPPKRRALPDVIDWDLTDPANRPIETVRDIRDDIDRRVEELIAELDQAERSSDSDPR
jgi:hypothetical protein